MTLFLILSLIHLLIFIALFPISLWGLCDLFSDAMFCACAFTGRSTTTTYSRWRTELSHRSKTFKPCELFSFLRRL